MAFLQIASLTASVQEFRRLPDERGGGSPRRTLNGHLRGVADWVKRGWGGVLIARDGTELLAILAVANPDTARTVSGDGLPTVTARVEVSADIEYVRIGSGWIYRVPVTIREV